MRLDDDNFFVPIIADPEVDDQGRPLPYDPNNVPDDGIAWGFDPDNNRWQGAVYVDGVTTQKYYDPNTKTWSNL